MQQVCECEMVREGKERKSEGERERERDRERDCKGERERESAQVENCVSAFSERHKGVWRGQAWGSGLHWLGVADYIKLGWLNSTVMELCGRRRRTTLLGQKSNFYEMLPWFGWLSLHLLPQVKSSSLILFTEWGVVCRPTQAPSPRSGVSFSRQSDSWLRREWDDFARSTSIYPPPLLLLLPLLLLPPTFSRNIYMWQDSEAPRTLYFLALGSRARIIKIQSDEDIRL